MTCCDHCVDSEAFFSRRTARRDLRRYRRKGMRASTRLLVDALRPWAPGATLLDIGGGVGAVQHELMGDGLTGATQVDASSAYLDASKEEAAREGHQDRVIYRFGDFADIADELSEADIVTLDRVICCYPDADRLVALSAVRSKGLYGVVIPRDRWFVRALLGAGNAFFWLRRSAFRTFIHPSERIEGLVRSLGFERVFDDQTIIWRVSVYRRIG